MASTDKQVVDMVEDSEAGHKLPSTGSDHEERLVVTDEDNKRIARKIDKRILVLLVWVYFLQILDKSVLGYGSLFGLQSDTGLVGSQYSLVGSIAPIAQLCILPFMSVLLVKVPPRLLMTSLVFGWGAAQACMAAANNYAGLLTTRFFLGLFEAACLPLFSIITSMWYRRAEQPLRVAAWYGTNGLATILGSALSFGLGHIPSNNIHSWQIIFIFVGIVTVLTAPVVWWRLDNDVEHARFLSEHEKLQAVERLRANKTGIGSRSFKWDHVLEVFLEPKTYLWFCMAMLLNVGAAVTNVFGPLILSGLGYDKYISSLLNMPFGAVQLIVILISSYAAQKAKVKSAILAALVLPVVVGLVMLYLLPRTSANQGPLLLAFYFLGCLFGGNPLIVSWMIANTAGQTKKSVVMVVYNIGVSVGNIIGPLLFNANDAPQYLPGLRAVMGLFAALFIIIFVQLANLMFLNKMQARKRVANGKSEIIEDTSMAAHFVELPADSHDDENSAAALHDLTDRKNDEFVYVY